jgi:2-methylfumaryl-CoA isomerase
LLDITGTCEVITAIEDALSTDFSTDGDRYGHRDILAALLTPWFTRHDLAQIETAFSDSSLPWSPHQTFSELISDERLTKNPIVQAIDQPGIG